MEQCACFYSKISVACDETFKQINLRAIKTKPMLLWWYIKKNDLCVLIINSMLFIMVYLAKQCKCINNEINVVHVDT